MPLAPRSLLWPSGTRRRCTRLARCSWTSGTRHFCARLARCCSWPFGTRCRCTRLARCPLGPDAAAHASLAALGTLGPDTSAHASLAAPGPLGPDAPAARSPPGQPPTLPQRRPVPRQRCWTSAPSARGVPPTSSTTRWPLRSARARRRRDRPHRARRYTAPPFAAPRPSLFLCQRPPHARLCRAPAAFTRPNANRTTAAAGSHATPPPPTRSQNAYPASRPVHHRRRPTDPGEPRARYQAAIVCRPRGRTLQPGGPGATHAAARASLAASGPRGEGGGGERVGKGGGRQQRSTVFLPPRHVVVQTGRGGLPSPKGRTNRRGTRETARTRTFRVRTANHHRGVCSVPTRRRCTRLARCFWPSGTRRRCTRRALCSWPSGT
jgi:hypothetical protein